MNDSPDVTKRLVNDIHKSSLYGIFIEIGAGTPLSDQLFQVAGASATVYSSHSLYSTDSVLERYLGFEDHHKLGQFRNVSFEFVLECLMFEKHLTHNGPTANAKFRQKVNFYWVSSFQLKDDGCNHGWIAYQFRDFPVRIFHLTLPKGDRQDLIAELGPILVRMIQKVPTRLDIEVRRPDGPFKLVDHTNWTYFTPKYADGSFEIGPLSQDWTARPPSGARKILQPNSYLIELMLNPLAYWVVDPRGCWARFEDYFRLNTEELNEGIPVIIYKGSFNPFHEGHEQIAAYGQNMYPHSPLGLMISIDTFQKKNLGLEELRARLTHLAIEKNQTVIVTHQGMYWENLIDLTRRLPKQKWVFLLGYDTYVRMEPRLFLETPFTEKVEYLVFDRNHQMKPSDTRNKCHFIQFDNPISSTELRKRKFDSETERLLLQKEVSMIDGDE